MTGLVALGFFCAILTIAMLAAFWYFAGIQYVILLCVGIFLSWLLQEFWPLIKYHSKGQR